VPQALTSKSLHRSITAGLDRYGRRSEVLFREVSLTHTLTVDAELRPEGTGEGRIIVRTIGREFLIQYEQVGEG
jgi:hypothetical protein